MIWLFPALSLLCTYGMVGCAYWGFSRSSDLGKWLLYGTLPLTLAVAVLCAVNLVCAVRACRGAGAGEALRLSRMGLVWKVLAIPYHLLNLLAWMLLSSAFLVIPGFQVFLLGLPLAVAASYLPLLTSSAYTVAAVVTARRRGMGIGWVHILWQLLFLTDVIDALVLFFKLRGMTKESDKKENKHDGSLCNGV